MIGTYKGVLPLSKGGRRYGFRPSLPDAFSKPFKISVPITLPLSVDLTSYLGSVKDQGQLGACTAFAATGYAEYLFRRFKNQQPVLSPLFLYYKEREFDGDLNQGDTGSFGSTAVQVLQQTGCCLESTDPYNISDYQNPPTAAQLAEAANYKTGAYHAVNTYDIKSALASQYPVLIGIAVYDSFESGDWGSNWVMPAPSGNQLGGHELYIKQYDDNFDCGAEGKGAWNIRNSWGESWGIKGDFWMPYSLLPAIISEARIFHFGKPW